MAFNHCRRLSYITLHARALVLLIVAAGQVFAAEAASRSLVEDTTSAQDLITNLPGVPPHRFKQYAGYVTVNKTSGKRFFYWFVEAAWFPDRKPLTLWLNGGPGCSSIGAGFLAELGPFFPNKSGSGLIPNNYSWNKESNVLFLESPAGVGFSYSDTPSDRVTGDTQTAIDNRAFLLGWFKKFPQYKNRPFYITGESYAGHYVPDLAYLLYQKRAADKGIINLKGLAVGNPWTVTVPDQKAWYQFPWDRNLASTATYKAVLKYCYIDEFYPGLEEPCWEAYDKYYAEPGNINPYDVYVDVCTGPALEAKRLIEMRAPKAVKKVRAKQQRASYDPCIDNEVDKYLNLPAVQKALHAAQLPYRWSACTPNYFLNYSMVDFYSSKEAIWVSLLKTPLRLTVYSGDTDSVCPTTGSREWIEKLEEEKKLAVSTPFYAWYQDQQVGGYATEYNKGQFKFITVRGAGHFVPYLQPARGLAVFRHFLRGSSLPTS